MNFVKDFWIIIWQVIGWFKFITFVYDWQEAIVLQTGRYRRTLKPGWRWHLPFALDEILRMNIKPAAMELAEQSLTTRDGVRIVCRGVLMWVVFDIRKCIVEVEDAEDTLEDIAIGVIQEQVELHDWDFIRSPAFRTILKKSIQKLARPWGMGVKTVKFQDLTESVSYRIFGGLAT